MSNDLQALRARLLCVSVFQNLLRQPPLRALLEARAFDCLVRIRGVGAARRYEVEAL